jgi:hypothetical protein
MAARKHKPASESILRITDGEARQLELGFFSLRPTGLIVRGKPSFEEWSQCGVLLHRMEGAVQWWIGDWLNYGERTYGRKYSEALSTLSLEEGTLRNYAFVAGNIQLSRRRDNVSFSVHSEAAALPTAKEQDLWLARADEGQWTRADARKQRFSKRPAICKNSGVSCMPRLDRIPPKCLSWII